MCCLMCCVCACACACVCEICGHASASSSFIYIFMCMHTLHTSFRCCIFNRLNKLESVANITMRLHGLMLAFTILHSLMCSDAYDPSKDSKGKQDHYKVLGIEKTATQKEVKRAYRKMSLKYHPDQHQGKPTQDDARKRFLEIAAAYEVLGDEDKRLLYDDFGNEKFYSKEAAQAAGRGSTKGFYVNNRNIVKLKQYMFNGWTFQGERAKGPLSKRDVWMFEFYAPWSFRDLRDSILKEYLI